MARTVTSTVLRPVAAQLPPPSRLIKTPLVPPAKRIEGADLSAARTRTIPDRPWLAFVQAAAPFTVFDIKPPENSACAGDLTTRSGEMVEPAINADPEASIAIARPFSDSEPPQ